MPAPQGQSSVDTLLPAADVAPSGLSDGATGELVTAAGVLPSSLLMTPMKSIGLQFGAFRAVPLAITSMP